MVLQVDIDAQTEARLRVQAQAAGKDVRAYVSELVEQAAARASLDEVLAPLRKRFAAMGVSDDQLIAEITQAQAEYRAEKHKRV